MVVTGQQIPLQPLSEAVLPGLSASEILDHDNTSPKVPVVSQPNLNSSDGNQPMETSSTQPEPEEELDEEKSLAISQFCEMTGSDPAYAKNVLVVSFLHQLDSGLYLLVDRQLLGIWKRLCHCTLKELAYLEQIHILRPLLLVRHQFQWKNLMIIILEFLEYLFRFL